MRRLAVPDARTILGRAGSENFPVAARFLPRSVRSDLMAIYGFARLVDDLGDEAAGDRMALLDWLEREIAAVFDGEPTHPLLLRLAPTVRRRSLPREPFLRLIQANRQDQVVRSYPTFVDLLDYCALSANPVGHLVLGVFGAVTPDRLTLSDAICTGLQLTEHWQDVAEDLGHGRVYLPEEDRRRFGVTLEDLAGPEASPGFRRLMAFQVARARDLLHRGAPLARSLRGRPGLAVHAFVAGGYAALEAIRRAGYDVLRTTPRASRAGRLWWVLRSLTGWRG